MSQRNKHQQEIQRLIAEAYQKVEEACVIADEHKIQFHFSLGYGMGGTYVPKGTEDEDQDGYGYTDTGWVSSSMRC